MSDGFIIFTYFIILLGGVAIGGATVSFFFMRYWIKNKLENLIIEIKEDDEP